MKLLVVGNSHIRALISAYENRSPEQAKALTAQFVWLRGRRGLDQTLRDEIARHATEADFLVSCIGGSLHNLFGLVNLPEPFDFVLDEATDLDLPSDRPILPEAVVRTMLEGRMLRRLSVLLAIRQLTPMATVQLEAPPCVADTDYILRHPGVFAEKMRELGVSPPTFRWKVWKLCSIIARGFCAEHSIIYVESPTQTRDDHGFLVEQAWNQDLPTAMPGMASRC